MVAWASYEENAEGNELGEHEVKWDHFQFLGQLTSFALWATLLYIIGKKTLPGFLSARRAAIEAGIQEAKRAKEEAEAKLAEYEARIAEMDKELARLREEMRRAAEAERTRILKNAEEKIEAMKAEARFIIEQRLKEARLLLIREAAEEALRSAEAQLKEQLEAKDQERLARLFIDRLAGKIRPQQGQNEREVFS
ncbi:MAG: ATP synthase F0 subunit B [Deltaproteobacteria bacterium]|nr:ATP synthase F0 subunit B [Deltaproteobacteria bacterium]